MNEIHIGDEIEDFGAVEAEGVDGVFKEILEEPRAEEIF